MGSLTLSRLEWRGLRFDLIEIEEMRVCEVQRGLRIDVNEIMRMFAHTKASRALAALSDPLVRKSVGCDADGTNQTQQRTKRR